MSGQRNYRNDRRSRGGGYRGERNTRHDNGGGYGGSGGYFEEEKPVEFVKQEQLNLLVYTIADQFTLKQSLEYVCTGILREWENGYHELVCATFKECIANVPHKVHIFGLLTAVINKKDPNIAAAIVRAATATLQDALTAASFRTVKLTLRFFAELVASSVIQAKQLLVLYKILLSVLHEPNLNPQRADAFVYAVLGSIPWAASPLSTFIPEELDTMLATIDAYIQSRPALLQQHGLSAAKEALRSYRDTDVEPYPQLDRLETLWQQVCQLKQVDQWQVNVLEKPVIPEYKLGEGDDWTFHEVEGVTVSGAPVKFNYQPVFWVFDDSVQTPENITIKLPPATSVARYILNDMVNDVVALFSHNHKETTRILYYLNNWLNAEYLKNAEYNHMASIVEQLFANLFSLPVPAERKMYYTTLLIDLVREDLERVPKVLGRAVRTLFSRLDSSDGTGGMDVELIQRFAEWFSIHLSNYGFVWKWADWNDIVKADADGESIPMSGQVVFVRETLERCIRLSYYDRVKGMIPEHWPGSNVFPASAPHPEYRYASAESCGDEKLFQVVQELKGALERKAPVDEIESKLSDIQTYASTRTSADVMDMDTSASSAINHLSPTDLTLDAFLQTLLLNGSKSFSHTLNIIERHLSLLKRLLSAPESKLILINTLSAFWSSNTQFLEIVLDKMMNYRVADVKSVLQWALSADVLASHGAKGWLWSVVRSSLGKSERRVGEIDKRIAELEASTNVENGNAMQVEEASGAADENGVNGEVDRKLEELAKLKDLRVGAEKEWRDGFIFVFQVFAQAFSAVNSDVIISRYALGMFRNLAREHGKEISVVKFTIEEMVFNSPVGVDDRVRKVWEEVKSVLLCA
ncbi:Nuclear cap-binding protein subunit 1 [Gaertneriomyces sp. JEL0708]|nr:Nuclear cap-binding protein subunit 1 [Gaertneriomyces sp. JEL0708]